MNKRLSSADYILSLFVIFILVVIVGSFFFGVKIGQDKTTRKYEQLNEERNKPQETSAYDQQVLVSFYHTIYLPFRQFQNKWFDQMGAIEMRTQSADTKSLLKELKRTADESYKRIESTSIPDSSPLLQDARSDYMKSLAQFANAIQRFHGETGGDSRRFIDAIEEDPHFQEAKNLALSGQQNYYESIVQWNFHTQPDLQHNDWLGQDDLNLDQWSLLNFNQKNDFIARQLGRNQYFKPFYPQDITLRVDDLIHTGQADKLGLNMAKRTIETLIDTNAVREGDFIHGKNKYYSNETIPQLPFFFQ